MVRPRGGGFTYDDHEFDAMKSDVISIVELGFPGVVFGILDADSDVDEQRCRTLVELARSIRPNIDLTFHRAFDEAREPINAYRMLTSLGFDRVLTSGQKRTAPEGSELLRTLAATGNHPAVMPGGGVRPGNVAALLSLGVTNVHSSATPSVDEGVDASTVSALAKLVHAR